MARLVRIAGVVLAIAVAGLLLVYVGHGLLEARKVSAAQDKARQSVEAARPVLDDVVARLDAAGAAAALGPVVERRSGIRCSIDGVGAGWVTQYYEQNCVAEASLTVASAGSAADVAEAMGGNVDAGGGCGSYILPEGADTAARAGIVVRWMDSAETAARCGPDDSSRAIAFGHHESAAAAEGAVVRFESREWLEPTELGCRPWSVIFCSAPVDEPALPASS